MPAPEKNIAEDEHDEPDDARAIEQENARIAHIGGERRNGARAVEVLGRLLLHDVHRIVMRDDADDPALIVHDRQGDHVVARNLPCRVFLIVMHGDRMRVAVHDVADQRAGRREDEILKPHGADQPPPGIGHIGAVDRLLVRCLAPQLLDRFGGRQMFGQRRVIRGHDGARGAVLIGGEAANVLALGLRQRRQQGFGQLAGHFVEQVGAFVRIHFRDEPGEFGARRGGGDAGLGDVIEIAEAFRLPRQRQQLQRRPGGTGVLAGGCRQRGGYVGGMVLAEKLGGRARFAALDQAEKCIGEMVVRHALPPSAPHGAGDRREACQPAQLSRNPGAVATGNREEGAVAPRLLPGSLSMPSSFLAFAVAAMRGGSPIAHRRSSKTGHPAPGLAGLLAAAYITVILVISSKGECAKGEDDGAARRLPGRCSERAMFLPAARPSVARGGGRRAARRSLGRCGGRAA
jgi:hypothetical protein